MIRRSAYRPEIDRMAARAFALWRELEAESGRNILNLIGEVALFDPAASERQLRRRGAAGVVGSKVGTLKPSDSETGTPDLTMGGRREVLDEAALRARFRSE